MDRPAASTPTRGFPRGRRSRASRLQGAFGGGLVALASTLGVLVGVRAVVAFGPLDVRSLLSLPPLPRVTFGVVWSHAALWPARIQAVALTRMSTVLLALAIAVAAVAVLNAIVLLAEAGASRRREIAVRAALGAGPWALLGRLLSDLRLLLFGGAGLGVLLGLASGALLRVTWPGPLDQVDFLRATGTVLIPVLGVVALTAVAYAVAGLGAASVRSLATELRVGERATDEARAVTLRRWLAAFQMSVAGSVMCATLALAGVGRPAAAGDGSGPADASVLDVRVPGRADAAAWEKMLGALASVPGMRAESLATPGALVGLGVQDYTLTQCGQCVRGLYVLPILGATIMHHAVGPGFFAATGRGVEEGRDFTSADGPGAPKVAIVNRTFAWSNFQDGEPLGHRIKIGSGLTDWYTVVGVVGDASPTAIGGPQRPRPAVWLSALQQPPARAEVLLRGTPAAVRAGADLLDAAGWASGGPSSLTEWRARAAAPVTWVGRVSLALALLVLLLAVHGVHVTSLQINRRRMRELAIRSVVGANGRRLLREALAGTLRGALWGAFGSVLGGTLLVGLLREVASGIPAPPVSVYLGVTAVLVLSALLASVGAARRAQRVEPARVLT